MAIQAAGGLSWILPLPLTAGEIQEAVRRSDGVMLTGGDDVQPGLYAPELPPSLSQTTVNWDAQRDVLELELIKAVFVQRKPLLAICRGQQILNVAFGGSLLVDIKTQLPQALNHARVDLKDELAHEIALAPGTLLGSIARDSVIQANSVHHQAVDRVAAPFRVSAISSDGVIEGLELQPANAKLLPYLLAVQFHPERLYQKHREHRDIFRTFISACAARGKQ